MESPLVSEDTLLVFVGHSSDADDEARAVCTLERLIQREVDARIEVMAGAHQFSKVKVWEWNAEAKANVGGQRQIIHPYLQRANVAIFVFKERIGQVTWEELNECRNQYSIPLIAAFPSTPPNLERMNDIDTVTNWHDLLTKKLSLSSDWVDAQSRSILPICEYRNVHHLKETVLEHIIRILGDLLRIRVAVEATGRSAPKLDVATYEELRLAYETTAISRHPCQGATIHDLDWELINQFAQDQAPSDDVEKMLENLGLFSPLSTSQKSLHNSAVLCFSKRPEKYIPQARSCFVLGDTQANKFTRVDVTGPLSRQVEKLEQLVTEHINRVSTFGEGALRRDDSEIPQNLIRELISNAVAHRDYNSHGIVLVSLTTGTLEVSNPGSFPGGVPWDWMLRRQFTSNPVDPAIAWYLTRLLALEGVGRGFSLFRDYISNNGKKALVCDRSANPATVTIRVRRPKLKTTPHFESHGSGKSRSGGWFLRSLLTRFLPHKSVIVCPYCFSDLSLDETQKTCPECQRHLPPSYKERSEQGRTAFVPLIGWSGMGKTTLLASCLHMLMSLSEVWPSFYCLYETQATLRMQNALTRDLLRGELPARTVSTHPEPFILSLHGMERWGDTRLVLHDFAGEVFSDLEIKGQYRFLERAKTILVVYSIKDLLDLHERSMDELLMSYGSTMSRSGEHAKREKKIMIVTLTKADLLDNLPETLQTYLGEDPLVTKNVTQLAGLKSAEGMAHYIDNMARVSEIIADWIARTADGVRFLNLARSLGLGLRFTICSALGAGISDDTRKLSSLIQPHRVLDPFFWLFETLKDQ
jgi:hypothetical protein